MNYTKYIVRSPLFALRDQRLSEQVLATFSGAPGPRPAPPPPPRRTTEEDNR